MPVKDNNGERSQLIGDVIWYLLMAAIIMAIAIVSIGSVGRDRYSPAD